MKFSIEVRRSGNLILLGELTMPESIAEAEGLPIVYDIERSINERLGVRCHIHPILSQSVESPIETVNAIRSGDSMDATGDEYENQ